MKGIRVFFTHPVDLDENNNFQNLLKTIRNGCSGYTAISIKAVPKQSEKVEYEREKLAGSCD